MEIVFEARLTFINEGVYSCMLSRTGKYLPYRNSRASYEFLGGVEGLADYTDASAKYCFF